MKGANNMAVTFEGYERRIDQIMPVLNKYGIKDLEEARKICQDKGFDPVEMVKSIQPICFDNACWAYTVGAAIAIKKGCTKAADAAKEVQEEIGEVTQSSEKRLSDVKDCFDDQEQQLQKVLAHIERANDLGTTKSSMFEDMNNLVSQLAPIAKDIQNKYQ